MLCPNAAPRRLSQISTWHRLSMAPHCCSNVKTRISAHNKSSRKSSTTQDWSVICSSELKTCGWFVIIFNLWWVCDVENVMSRTLPFAEKRCTPLHQVAVLAISKPCWQQDPVWKLLPFSACSAMVQLGALTCLPFVSVFLNYFSVPETLEPCPEFLSHLSLVSHLVYLCFALVSHLHIPHLSCICQQSFFPFASHWAWLREP